MANLTIDQTIEHLHWMADKLEEYKHKYPDAKWRWLHLSLNWEKFEDMKWDGDGVWYWGINGQELWIDLHPSSQDEDED